jgi:hypothetical protein
MKTKFNLIFSIFLMALLLQFPEKSLAQEDNINTEPNVESDTIDDSLDETVQQKIKVYDYSQIFTPPAGKAIFVCKATGKNSNSGTREQPLQDLDQAIEKASSGDVIVVAGGTYSKVGTFFINKSLKLYGSFDNLFTKQDLNKNPTLLQPDNISAEKTRKAVMVFNKDVNGTIIDGFIFDAGERNAYSATEGKSDGLESGNLYLPPNKDDIQKQTIEEPLLSVEATSTGGDILIENNIFLNSPNYGIQAANRCGTIKIINNVFVANRQAAIEIYSSCSDSPNQSTPCGQCVISKNTILFTWSKLVDFLEMGIGIRIRTGLEYYITDNFIGANINSGIDNTILSKKEWFHIDNNTFFANRHGDMVCISKDNNKQELLPDAFEDIKFASVVGNVNEIPENLKVDPTYTEAFLNARYTDELDYEDFSVPNQWRDLMKMSKHEKSGKKTSMFVNRYPWRKAIDLFGNDEDRGAQLFY